MMLSHLDMGEDDCVGGKKIESMGDLSSRCRVYSLKRFTPILALSDDAVRETSTLKVHRAEETLGKHARYRCHRHSWLSQHPVAYRHTIKSIAASPETNTRTTIPVAPFPN